MEKPAKFSDAWDDDWVTNADSSTKVTDPLPSNKKLSKSERRARQAEFNKQIWEDAEAPKDSYFLNTRGDVPLKTDFKPAVKVLSRKPTPNASGAVDSNGLQQLNIEDDEDDDEDDAGKKVLSLEERQQKAAIDREEKQKKYEEARQRLFGSGSTDETQPREGAIPLTTQPSGGLKGQSKSRGGRDTRPSSFIGSKTRQLFDPNSASKSDSAQFQKQEGQPKSGSSTLLEQQVIRNPRGPEKTGKGGFGFVLRDSGET